MPRHKKMSYACGNDNCENVGTGYKKCGTCKIQRYCSKECQKAHWKKHKSMCKRLCGLCPTVRIKAHMLKDAVRKSSDLWHSNKITGNDKGLFLLDLNVIDTGVLQWTYFNFTRHNWSTKLEVSAAQLELILRQQREEIVCGLLLGNRIEIVLNFTKK